MPWKVTTTMEQKIEFICEWRTGKHTITELCRSFEIARPTAYRLIDRFEKLGFEGLKEQSRSPTKDPNATADNIAESILNLKGKHKLWGAKKIRILLFNDFTDEEVPSVVTVHNILKKKWFGMPSKENEKSEACIPYFRPKNMQSGLECRL
jgi:transposase